VRGHHRNVALGELASCSREGVFPVAVEAELPAWDFEELTVRGVIRKVALEERPRLPHAGERRDQSSPESRVPVAPGRADGQVEHDELHAAKLAPLPSPFQCESGGMPPTGRPSARPSIQRAVSRTSTRRGAGKRLSFRKSSEKRSASNR